MVVYSSGYAAILALGEKATLEACGIKHLTRHMVRRIIDMEVTMELNDLLEILKVLNGSQSFTELHGKVMEKVLEQVQTALEQNLQHSTD